MDSCIGPNIFLTFRSSSFYDEEDSEYLQILVIILHNRIVL